MTDANQPTIDMAAIMQRYSQWEADAAQLVPENKARLFACLASVGITLVTVTFDGYGDSGQIEDIAAFIGDEPADLPGGTVEVKTLHHGADQPVTHHLSAREEIESLVYDLLGQAHCGWENNDGAYGQFTFDVTTGTIALDYNERFTSSENFRHEW